MDLPRRPLATTLFALAMTFLLLALSSIALTLWMTWQIEGGAAAVNESGRMRMQSYRFAWRASGGMAASEREAAVAALDSSLEKLRRGDTCAPLFVPWNAETRERFADVSRQWERLRDAWLLTGSEGGGNGQVDEFVACMDSLISAIEQQIASQVAMLRGFAFALVLLAVASTAVFLYAGRLFVLEPVQRLKAALARVSERDFSVRLEARTHDEFGELAPKTATYRWPMMCCNCCDLCNVRKHAHARRVVIHVQRGPPWCFEVRDDGCGFYSEDASSDETHFGLLIMRERAARIGGHLDIASTPGKGANVMFTVNPMPADAVGVLSSLATLGL
ncbi:MAG TPA: type IV pili methyl-accepting chemotaxis transducer N-terminal domain-containing protein [Burkholderiaceae bacterium]|nr:type IV pili methyl-accepting chemotaxis transducer N-terminal domain-containing protein [Burkholderiaceae bacterium]